MEKKYKIAIVGPESSGKSHLCDFLYKKGYSITKEYARSYLEQSKIKNYSFQDVEHIARKQIELEDLPFKEAQIFDTDLMMIYVWFIWSFQRAPYFLKKQLLNSKIDFYIILYPNISWEEDPLRENENNREKLFSCYIKLINRLNKPYTIINSSVELRNQDALDQITKII